MGYWVTLLIAVADAFHYRFPSIHLSLFPYMCGSVCVLNDMAMADLSCLIEFAQAFLAYAAFMFLQGIGIK